MKTDLFSCNFCGIVMDVEILKGIQDKKSESQQMRDDYDGTYDYCNFEEFEKIRCPCCHKLNQRCE